MRPLERRIARLEKSMARPLLAVGPLAVLGLRPKPRGALSHSTAQESTDILRLSLRARKCLNRLNIKTIGYLCKFPADAFLGVTNGGMSPLAEIRESLKLLGLRLNGD